MARKTSKPASPATSAPSAVTLAYDAILPALIGQAEQIAANAEAGKSRSRVILDAIGALASSFAGNVEAYTAACVELFGNGDRKKDSRVEGKLAAELKARKITAPTVYKTLTHARTVAANWARGDVRKSADDKGLDAAYQTAKPPVVSTEKETTAATADNTVDVATVAKAWIVAHMDEAMEVVRAFAIRAKDSILVNKIGEIEIHLSSKTQKTG